jgi:large conductance mechanosensitive channel
LYYVLDNSKGVPASLADAKAKGIPVVAHGALINDAVNFLIIAFVVFLVVRSVNKLQSLREKPVEEATTKECPFCLSTIPVKATRCAHCTVELKAA